MRHVNPQLLVTLWNVARCGSLAAAAREIGWSQPAVSQQIHKLQDECGCVLLKRTSHGVTLTPAGQLLAKHGEMIANRLLQAEQDLAEYRRGSERRLHVLAPPSICSTILARTLVRIGQTSDITVRLTQMEPPEAVRSLAAGGGDCALVFQYDALSRAPLANDDCTVEYCGRDPLRLLVPRSSAIGRQYERDGEPVDLSRLADQRWIAGCETCRANLMGMARSAGFVPVITHSTEDTWVTQNLVEMGQGVSIVSALSIHNALQGDLTACPIADDRAYRTIEMVTRKGDERPELQRLREAIRQTAKRFLMA